MTTLPRRQARQRFPPFVGADANAIAPKRPLSSMTPTFVEKPDG
jgi:gamma-glutamyltranspeptidase